MDMKKKADPVKKPRRKPNLTAFVKANHAKHPKAMHKLR